MLKRLAVVGAIVLALAVSTQAQLEWDKKKIRPLPNPVPISASRAAIETAIRELLEQNEISVKSEGAGERGTFVVTTEPVVFARGIVAKTQLGHFADLSPTGRSEFSRGRVAMRIEIEPSTLTTSLVSVAGTFEGFRTEVNQWSTYQSRGLLEDKFLKLLVSRLTGQAFDDVEADDRLLEAAGQ